jgi:hypothetical protein
MLVTPGQSENLCVPIYLHTQHAYVLSMLYSVNFPNFDFQNDELAEKTTVTDVMI